MKRRQRRSREEWGRVIGEQQRSGLAAAEFCRRQGIGISSFYQWKQRLADDGERGGAAEQQSFIDMGRVDVPASSAIALSESRAASLEVTLELGDGVRLVLRRG